MKKLLYAVVMLMCKSITPMENPAISPQEDTSYSLFNDNATKTKSRWGAKSLTPEESQEEQKQREKDNINQELEEIVQDLIKEYPSLDPHVIRDTVHQDKYKLPYTEKRSEAIKRALQLRRDKSFRNSSSKNNNSPERVVEAPKITRINRQINNLQQQINQSRQPAKPSLSYRLRYYAALATAFTAGSGLLYFGIQNIMNNEIKKGAFECSLGTVCISLTGYIQFFVNKF